MRHEGVCPSAMPHHLQFSDWVLFPLTQVFAVFSNPDNLPRLMPPASETRIDRLDLVSPSPFPDSTSSTEAAGIGTGIVTSFRLFPFLPMRAQWIACITEFEWNHHFADVQKKGPFQRWHHRHEFVAERCEGVSGTLVRDIIEYYEVGFAPVGVLANWLFVGPQMRRTFAQPQQRLSRLLL